MSTLSHSIESNKNSQEDSTPVDTGLIRCICPSTEDDGFTIQCERCLVWQHAYCVQITHENIPDHYLCDRCTKRKRPKLSKRFPISKKKLKKLDAEDDPSINNKKRKLVKSRIISRYVYPIFKEAKERWSKFKLYQDTIGPILYDHGPFVTMDSTTLLTKGVLIDTPVSNQGLFTTRSIPSLRYLMEITGDILLKSEFKFDPINDFVILGTPLSHIMFYPTLDLCIDTRQFGNKARYIRRSCHPNAELRNVILSNKDDKTIHLGLFARHLIEKGQEVTISWNWQRGHIAWKENMNWHHQHKISKQQGQDEGHQVIDEEEERRRKSTIKNMLDRFEKEFGTCACLNKRRCLIEQLRKQIAPPKEKPIFKLPSTIHMKPTTNQRRKSSIILLKPKLLNKEESSTVDIDVTSNSPTLGIVKDDEDDELVDVEGDIDIGDDLPIVKDNLPLLDNNSSDEDDNGDLSSLSSLSSLSVFEESGNDITDDEDRRSKARRKKASSRHRDKSSRSSHQNKPSSSSAPAIEKTSPVVPTALPRKKLWMRDYLNKHPSEASKPTDTNQQPLKSDETSSSPLKAEEKIYTNIETESHKKESLPSEPIATKIDTNSELMQIDEPTTILSNTHSSEETIAPLPTLPTEEKNEIVVENNNTTDEHKMDIDIHNNNDIDEGELSDASTILLDEEEIRHVYTQNPTTSESLSESQHNEPNIAESSTSQKEDIDVATVSHSIPMDNKEEDISIDEEDTQTSIVPEPVSANISQEVAQSPTIPEESSTKEEQPPSIPIPDQQSLPIIEADKSTTEKEDIVTVPSPHPTTKEESPTKEMDEDVEKKIVKKISLQEYLSKQQKSIHP